MQKERRIRILRRFVVGLAVAAIVAPAAHARPDEGTATQGNAKDPGAVIRGYDKVIVSWGERQAYVVRATRTPEQLELAAATQAYVAGAAPTSEQLELAAATQAYVAGAAPLTPQPTQVGTNPSDGFNWGDAGLGAGTVFAVMLLGAGALLATRQLGRRATI